jgi:hypothetical protein
MQLPDSVEWHFQGAPIAPLWEQEPLSQFSNIAVIDTIQLIHEWAIHQFSDSLPDSHELL